MDEHSTKSPSLLLPRKFTKKFSQFPSQNSRHTQKESPKLQGTHPISCKTNISKRDKMFLADHKKRNLQNIRGKLRSDPYLDPK